MKLIIPITCLIVLASVHVAATHGTGNLRVYARYGHDLPDEDGWWNDSDPYLSVTAEDAYGYSTTLHTTTKQGDHSPVWHQWLAFGTQRWTRIIVRVYDRDPGRDDPLSARNTYGLSLPITRTNVMLRCYSGYVIFDYHFD